MSSTPVDKLSPAEKNQLGLSYAAFVLSDSGAKITQQSLKKVLEAAGLKVQNAWVNAFAKTFSNRSVDSFLSVSGGSGSSQAAQTVTAGKKDDKKKEQKKEQKKQAPKKQAPPPPPVQEQAMDMGGLFDF